MLCSSLFLKRGFVHHSAPDISKETRRDLVAFQFDAIVQRDEFCLLDQLSGPSARRQKAEFAHDVTARLVAASLHDWRKVVYAVWGLIHVWRFDVRNGIRP